MTIKISTNGTSGAAFSKKSAHGTYRKVYSQCPRRCCRFLWIKTLFLPTKTSLRAYADFMNKSTRMTLCLAMMTLIKHSPYELNHYETFMNVWQYHGKTLHFLLSMHNPFQSPITYEQVFYYNPEILSLSFKKALYFKLYTDQRRSPCL